MGHIIQGFIGNATTLDSIISPLDLTTFRIVELQQEFYLLFLSDNIYDAIHKVSIVDNNYGIEPFDFFNLSVKEYIESVCFDECLVYIETEYFGGKGTQCSGVIKKGKLMEVYRSSTDDINIDAPSPERLFEQPINKALRQLGVIRNIELDEFDTLGLGNYRHMPYNDI